MKDCVKLLRFSKGSAQIILVAVLFLCAILLGQTSYAQHRSSHANAEKLSNELNTFYHAPSFSQYQSFISAFAMSKDDSYQIIPSFAVFAVMAVAKHTNYAAMIEKNFSHFSSLNQRYLLSVLLATNHKKLANNLAKTHNLKPLQEKFMTPKEIKSLKIKTTADLDYLWAAYFATGDSIFIKKIIIFINHSKVTMMVGYEMVNRAWICNIMQQRSKKPLQKPCPDFSDLLEAINARYPQSSRRVFHQATVVSAAIWSIDSNRNQDKVLQAKITAIFKNYPTLNYWTKIHQSLK